MEARSCVHLQKMMVEVKAHKKKNGGRDQTGVSKAFNKYKLVSLFTKKYTFFLFKSRTCWIFGLKVNRTAWRSGFDSLLLLVIWFCLSCLSSADDREINGSVCSSDSVWSRRRANREESSGVHCEGSRVQRGAAQSTLRYLVNRL